MNPEAPLTILTALADFLLQVTFVFAALWCVSRLLSPPNRRFILWLSFLVGAGCYWILLATRTILGGTPPLTVQHSPPYASSLGPRVWEIPGSWGPTLSIGLHWAAVLYLLMLGCFFILGVRKHVHLRWVLGFTCKPPKDVEELFRTIGESLRVSNCRLLLLTGITSPATLGWIRPIVLLPTLWLEQNSAELEDVLRHELHHIRRKDFLFGRIAALFRALLFFHPAVWYVVRELQFERELACDLAVVSDSPARRMEYAECLVRFARLNVEEREKPWGIDFAGASDRLTARVRSVLNVHAKSAKWALCLRATAAMALLVASLTILPSLTVALSYIQQQVAQLPETTRYILQPHARVRASAAKRNRHTMTSAPINPAVTTALSSHQVDDPLARLALVSPKYPHVVYALSKPKDVASPTPESEGADTTANRGVPLGRHNQPGIQPPSLTSVTSAVIGAARQLGDHGHDHDKD